MPKEYACGIDVGLMGCFSVLSKDGRTIKYEEHRLMPKKANKVVLEDVVSIMLEFQQKYPYLTVIIEKQGAVARQGRTSGFTTGRRMGFLEGVCYALRIPTIVVAPQTWQKIYNRQVKIPAALKNKEKMKDTKKRSLTWCKQKFPEVKLVTPKGRHLDELSDSILIANWGLTKGIKR